MIIKEEKIATAQGMITSAKTACQTMKAQETGKYITNMNLCEANMAYTGGIMSSSDILSSYLLVDPKISINLINIKIENKDFRYKDGSILIFL